MIRYSLILVLLMLSTYSYGQDTIYVSDQAKSYLLFDEVVSLADIGNPMRFEASIEGKSVMVIAKEDSVPPTPFYAVVGGNPFKGILVFHATPQAFYDFRKVLPLHNKANGSTLSVLEKKLVMKIQPDLNYTLQKKHGITFQLVGLMHDHSATYLKFYVKNHTSMLYQTESVGFERIKKYRKGFFAKKHEAHFPITPHKDWEIRDILPYSSGYLYFVLPLQALEAKESVMATLREKGGRRSVSLKLPYSMIKRADHF